MRKTLHMLIAAAALTMTTTMVSTVTLAADWAPSGPIKMLIGFRAGGGVDTQARLIAEELEARHGWKIIPANLPGAGGLKLGKALPKEPNDGLTVGFLVSETLGYNMMAAKDPGFTLDDFTYLTAVTGSQMSMYAKSSKDWKDFEDMIAAAKAGEKITVGAMSQKLADAAYLLGKENGVEFTIVGNLKGGKGVMNAMVADDIDAGFGAGIQNKGVAAGDFVHLVNGEAQPLLTAADVKSMSDYGVPYDMGAKFMLIGPAGMPTEAADAISNAIAEIIQDPATKVNKMITKAFSGPEPIQGDDLRQLIEDGASQARALLDASSN